jgi:Tfp pilus assembly protein PilX
MKKTMKKQKGAALIVSLVLLTLVALLGVAGVQTIGLEEKMAGHSFDRNLMFQAAEAMLKEKEGIVDTLTFLDSGCIDGLGLCTGECVCDGSDCAPTTTPCYRDPKFPHWSSPTFDQGLCRRTLIEKIKIKIDAAKIEKIDAKGEDGASVTRYRITAAVYRPASGDANGCANPDQRQGLVILQSLIG